ncbi:ABC transporter ATP-binding protein [Neobacillus sp. LXY-1]|uniref:ABC transporter ATP-binding protein n=1 Tax=Neobacillus sp. LXY-1 TaxID=3379133 RepID=UPI003EE3157D
MKKEVSELLQINHLTIQVKIGKHRYDVIRDVSFSIKAGEILGIVGESGCGKSVLSHSIIGLQTKSMKITKGEIFYQSIPLQNMNDEERRQIRGKEISMIFQDPMSSLNPSLTIGEQILEMFRLHKRASRQEAKEQTIEILGKVGLSRASEFLNYYPHQLSGGMQQRIMIAIALACKPSLLIADEPTTALDVTIQAQILDLMKKKCKEDGTAILLISHDFGVMAEMCDRIAVMYAGELVEVGIASQLLQNPQHPYTQGLLKSIPIPEKKNTRLYSIKGTVPDLSERGGGCPFYDRCDYAFETCKAHNPAFEEFKTNHKVKCVLSKSHEVNLYEYS